MLMAVGMWLKQLLSASPVSEVLGLGPAGDGVDLLRLADDVPLEPAQVGREGEGGGAADPGLGVVLALAGQLLAGPRPRVQPPSG